MRARQRSLKVEGPSDDRFTIASALFLSMFAAQASVLVLSPILADVADAFGVSVAVAGQLRSLSGVTAGIVALFATRLAHRIGLRRLVGGALLLLALASFASALAPTFVALATAQIALGAALAGVLSGAIAAAEEWPHAEARRRVLSWALNGQPTAWVVGLPLIGIFATYDWRLALLVVPLGSALLALLALRRVPPTSTATTPDGTTTLTPVLRRPPVARWAAGELLAFAAWSGTLVFAGSLFVQSYGASPAMTALMLGGAAIAYVPGNLVARRAIDGGSSRPLAFLAGGASIGALVFGAARPVMGFSAAVFALLALLAGARTFAGSIRGMALAPDARVAVTGLRAAATQFGYLLGTALGGAALAVGGYTGLALMLSLLFALAALPHLTSRPSRAGAFGPDGPDPADRMLRQDLRTRDRAGLGGAVSHRP